MEKEIHPETYRAAILKASQARYAARAVLLALATALDYRTLTACLSRAALIERTGYMERTVKPALAHLRATGEIRAVAFAQGGRGRAPVYSFPRAARYLERGAIIAPVSATGQTVKGGNLRHKGGQSTSERGANFAPPSYPLNILKGGEAAASRGAGRVTAEHGTTWSEIREGLDIAEKAKAVWLEPLRTGPAGDGVVTLLAQSSFAADYVRREYGDAILSHWSHRDRSVVRLDIRQGGGT